MAGRCLEIFHPAGALDYELPRLAILAHLVLTRLGLGDETLGVVPIDAHLAAQGNIA